MLLWQNPYSRSDENRRSHTLLSHKSEPTNERELNQACLYYAERGGGRRSQMFVKACANELNAKFTLAFYNECRQGSPKAAGRRTDNVDDIK